MRTVKVTVIRIHSKRRWYFDHFNAPIEWIKVPSIRSRFVVSKPYMLVHKYSRLCYMNWNFVQWVIFRTVLFKEQWQNWKLKTTPKICLWNHKVFLYSCLIKTVYRKSSESGVKCPILTKRLKRWLYTLRIWYKQTYSYLYNWILTILGS